MLALRPTEPGDVSGILALISEIFREYDCILDAQNEDTHLLAPGPHFRTRGGEFWVVVEDGAAAPIVRATVAVLLHPDAGELKCLYVHRALRGHGWGRRLSEITMDFARSAGRRRMILWSDTRFLNAHRLYRSLGFEQRGERDLNDSNNSREFGFERAL